MAHELSDKVDVALLERLSLAMKMRISDGLCEELGGEHMSELCRDMADGYIIRMRSNWWAEKRDAEDDQHVE